MAVRAVTGADGEVRDIEQPILVVHQTDACTMGTFELYTDNRGEFRFRLKAGNGEIILKSEGYANKGGAENGIRSVRTSAPLEERYVRKESDAGSSFNLKAGNGEVIGTSEVYASKQGRDGGIASVKANAPGADLVVVG